MNLIHLLEGEHALLRTAFDYYEKAVMSWNMSQLGEAARILETLVMAHSDLEDRLLFDALPPKNDGVRTTLGAMRDEHARIRTSFDEVLGEKSIREGQRRLLKLIGHIKDHFAVEERVLFELAENTLGPAQLETLGEEYARQRGLGLSPA